jgi:hypothetical protein
MFIATWFIVLFMTLCMLYLAFIIWLAHSLEGYPAFMISHASRDIMRSSKAQFAPHGSAVFNPLADRRSIRARPELWTDATSNPRPRDTAKRHKTAAT